MTDPPLYPLRFESIFQYRLWGGRRLADWLDAALPGDGPIGEAWLLGDRDDHPSRAAEGPLKGRAIARLMASSPELVHEFPDDAVLDPEAPARRRDAQAPIARHEAVARDGAEDRLPLGAVGRLGREARGQRSPDGYCQSRPPRGGDGRFARGAPRAGVP